MKNLKVTQVDLPSPWVAGLVFLLMALVSTIAILVLFQIRFNPVIWLLTFSANLVFVVFISVYSFEKTDGQ